MPLDMDKLERGLKQAFKEFDALSLDVADVAKRVEQSIGEVGQITAGATSLAVEDMPEAQKVAAGLMETTREMLGDLTALSDKLSYIAGKSGAMTGHGIEASTSLVELSEHVARLETDMEKQRSSLAVKISMVNAVKEIIAADPTASIELLELIGPEVVKVWLDKQ